jgi:transcriptional regulator with XRE-family HTH domain
MPRFGQDRPKISRDRMDYEVARVPRELTTAVTWYMEQKGVGKDVLAERLGVAPGRVSQILSGDENLTVCSLAAVCAALDARLEAKLVDDGRGDRSDRGFGWPASGPVWAPSNLTPARFSYSHGMSAWWPARAAFFECGRWAGRWLRWLGHGGWGY